VENLIQTAHFTYYSKGNPYQVGKSSFSYSRWAGRDDVARRFPVVAQGNKQSMVANTRGSRRSLISF
jgi:hypothetical protein